MMGQKEDQHRHLMDSLRQSRDKKEGAMQLVRETEQRLQEAELQCRDLTKASFEQCRPCLEDTCKAFYMSACRRGFTSFTFKVEEFFRKMASQLEATELVNSQNEDNIDHTNSPKNQLDDDEMDLELTEELFSQLLTNISLLYNQSIALAKKMQQVFGHSFLAVSTTELQPLPAAHSGLSPGYFSTMGLDHIFDSGYDLWRNVLEALSFTVADVFEEVQETEDYFHQSSRVSGWLQGRYMCRRLRRQASECWQLQDLCETCKDYLLKECPSVQELHSEMEEMHMLLNASRQRYNDRLRLVQTHTADTHKWLSSMIEKYGWISWLSNSTVNAHNIFKVIRVIPWQQTKNIRNRSDSNVVVTILNSAPVTVLVPAGLEVDDPAFIQYAAQAALTMHK
ncbi:hypothetical protein Q5P01_004210 [Channa striata]|uniref:Clusterin n=1 Tax=Channa striata TaxID=64152 RepID=A0AA88T3F0_CHASR|nr:hypothetical protein Q5P01_004210 [Channa striata]